MISTFAKSLGGGDQIGRYRIVKAVDEVRGVYLADESIGGIEVRLQTVAMEPQMRNGFLSAMRRIGDSGNEHIISIVDCGETEHGCYVVSEFLKGESLQARLDREHRLPLNEAIRVAREIASALAATHSKGIIHRDVCPDNIWLEPSGHAHLTGFAPEPAADDSLLNRLSGPGTPGYLAPEQAAGEAVTPAADLFSLGCILYQMTTGERPFSGGNEAALFRAVVFHHPSSARKLNPEISDALESLIASLLAKMPLDRPASALEVEQRLMQTLDPSATTTTLPAPSICPASKRILATLAETKNIEAETPAPTLKRLEIVVAPTIPRRRTWLPDLIAGLLLVIGAAGLYLWWKASNEPPPQPPTVKLESGKR
jgi:eukaryotic-like serine/threonine-protein kinase